MEQAVQWIAPVATTIAAIMTAANGGARLTGYGFVVFAAGSVAWACYGWLTGQGNLLIQNAILLVINIMGIWRWLGRAARYEDGAEAAVEAADVPLVPVSALAGLPAEDREGAGIGTVADAMMSCSTGRMIYVTISMGGVAGLGEKLIAVPWADMRLSADRVIVNSVVSRLQEAPGINPGEWPATVHQGWDRPAL